MQNTARLASHTDPINVRREIALTVVQTADLDCVLFGSAEPFQPHWIVSGDVFVPVVAYGNGQYRP